MTRVGDETLQETRPSSGRRASSAAAPYLVLGLECERPLVASARIGLEGVREVLIGRGAERRVRREGADRVIVEVPDRWMSGNHARLLREDAGWTLADQGSKNGTFLEGAAVTAAPVRGDALLEAGRTLFLLRAAPAEAASDRAVDTAALDGALATLEPGLEIELERLARIAPSEVPVLILGATGTGKELAARAVHRLSRRAGPLVDVNCGALPDNLVESELFGHRKGAFSGADADAPGLIRGADGGTLFLDEVAELPLESQAALLRVLQERRVRPVGEQRSVEVDVRVVAATLQDLPARVAEGSFRRDLYARLAGAVVRLPELRDRREDLGLLVGALLRRLAPERAERITFTREAARALYTYEWPLNVRELEHALQAALAYADGDDIDLPHLPAPVRGSLERPRAAPAAPEHTLERRLDELLREHGGNVSAVARQLGKAPMQVYRWLRRFGIDVDGYRR